MTAEPEIPLSPEVEAALWDLFAPREPRTVDEAALLALALGLADAEARLAAAQAMLDSPSLRARYLQIRARVREQLGLEADFADAARSSERVAQFVARLVEKAEAIDRRAAEGRWADAAESLRNGLPDLRAAWRLAGASELWEPVESMVRALAVPLMETGADEEFAELAALGYRASDALGRPGLRSWLLSYEGVWVARRGDSGRALALWARRIELNRSLGNRAAEADALLDTASLLRQSGDRAGFLGMLDEVERAVTAAGRVDLEASFWAMLADDRLREGDPEGAVDLAQRGLETLRCAEGVRGTGLYVRYGAARALIACDRSGEAISLLGDALAICVEDGQSSAAASSLSELAVALEAQDRIGLARRCHALALAIHRWLGSRHAAAAEEASTAFGGRHPAPPSEMPNAEIWEAEARAILDFLRESRPIPALA